METPSQKLSTFTNPEFDRGASAFKQSLWYLCNTLFIKSSFPFSGLKVTLLKMFGAQIGKRVLIKPNVNIKYPWKLTIGNDVWVGEKVWIDNLDRVDIGNNVCLSQGAMLLCGNHNFNKSSFDLFTKPIILEEGVWICAKAIVGPGVTCKKDSILSPMSFANQSLEEGTIFEGNPARYKRKRFS